MEPKAAEENRTNRGGQPTSSGASGAEGNQKALEEIAGYFDNLAAETTTERAVLEELVKANATLTSTNEELVAVVKRLTGENKSLQQEVNGLCHRLGTDGANTGPAAMERKTKDVPELQEGGLA